MTTLKFILRIIGVIAFAATLDAALWLFLWLADSMGIPM